MQEVATDLRNVVEKTFHTLIDIDGKQAGRRPQPEKWSIIEIIGHLVDSAHNNHRRFVMGQWQETLVFEGYEQNKWVDAQKYPDSDWKNLLNLWKFYNLHIAHIIAHTPEEIAQKRTPDHNFDKISMYLREVQGASSLAALMKDYVDHLVHHVKQIDAILANA